MKKVESLRSEVKEIKTAVNEIDKFQHREVRPEYIRKLKKISATKGKTYTSIEELDRDVL